jgi:hypothetical protein
MFEGHVLVSSRLSTCRNREMKMTRRRVCRGRMCLLKSQDTMLGMMMIVPEKEHSRVKGGVSFVHTGVFMMDCTTTCVCLNRLKCRLPPCGKQHLRDLPTPDWVRPFVGVPLYFDYNKGNYSCMKRFSKVMKVLSSCLIYFYAPH